MIDPSRFKSGQLFYIFIIHHKVSIRVNKAGGIQPQYYRVVFPGFSENHFPFLVRQTENIHHHIKLVIRHILPCTVVVKIIIHRRADPRQIRGPVIIQHERIRIHGNGMTAFLIINQSDFIFLIPVKAVGELRDFLLSSEQLINLLMLIPSAFRMLVKPPGIDILAQDSCEIPFQGDDAVPHIIKSHGVPVKAVLQMGSAVLLRHKHLTPQPEGILHLSLRHAAARLSVIINARRREKIHITGVQNRKSGGGCTAVKEIGASVGTIKSSHDLSGITLL